MEFTLLLLSSLLLSARAAVASDAVLDTDGNKLQRGQLYYAVSVRRPGGGLTLVAFDESCPRHVAQAGIIDLVGRALTFFPENTDDDTVQEGLTSYIKFAEPSGCSESTMWKLDVETSYVVTGGSASASIGPANSRFAIRKVEDSDLEGYEFHACPCSIGADRPSCRMGCLGSLGLVEEGSNTLIGIGSDRPHTVNFVKVTDEAEQYSLIRSALMRPN